MSNLHLQVHPISELAGDPMEDHELVWASVGDVLISVANVCALRPLDRPRGVCFFCRGRLRFQWKKRLIQRWKVSKRTFTSLNQRQTKHHWKRIRKSHQGLSDPGVALKGFSMFCQDKSRILTMCLVHALFRDRPSKQ